MIEKHHLLKVSAFHLRVMLIQGTVELAEQMKDDTLPPIANLTRWGLICASVIAGNREVIQSLDLREDTTSTMDQACIGVALSCLACLEQTRICMKARPEASDTAWAFEHFKMHMALLEFEAIINDPELMLGLASYVDQSMIDDVHKMLAAGEGQVSINALFKISDAVSDKLGAKYIFRNMQAPDGKLH